MAETVAGALAKQTPVSALVEKYAGEFSSVLPSHIGQDRYVRWCLTFLRQAANGKQAEAWARVLGSPAGQLSVMHALMECATLGLEPGRTYHLVPFNEKDKDTGRITGTTVTGITDYKGEIELIYRAGPYPVVANLVHAGDDFSMVGGNVPPIHEGDWFGDRGPVVGGYSYCQLGPDLYTQVVHMPEAGFLQHRAKAKTVSVWDEWPEQMRLKTLVHQLRKYAPWSVEVRHP